MFDKIIGNEEIQELLKQTIKSKRASHSYLFVGTEGIGKKQIAKEFAKALLCIEENKYCGKCKSCIEFDNNNNPDFILIEPEESSIKIDQIREIQRKVVEKPIISRQKVYIIDDSDKMTPEAQNGLLKTLEEPPEYITIILVCSNDGNLLSTIKSRCTRIQFEPISNNEIKHYIEQQGQQISDNIVELSEGSIGKAIHLNEKKEIYENIEKILLNMQTKDLIDIVQMSEIIYKSKEEINSILEYINVLLLKLSKQNIKYIKCIETVEETKRRLKANSNYDMCIDYMIFTMWQNLMRK